MPFDPTKPANGSDLDAAVIRDQLTSLRDAIAAVPAGPAGPPGVTGAVVDNTGTAPPGNPATASVSLTGSILHFNFTMPEGQTGAPGEVTQAQLSNDLVNNANATFNIIMPLTSNNSNTVSLLSLIVNDPPTQWDVQTIANKVDELINALRR